MFQSEPSQIQKSININFLPNGIIQNFLSFDEEKCCYYLLANFVSVCRKCLQRLYENERYLPHLKNMVREFHKHLYDVLSDKGLLISTWWRFLVLQHFMKDMVCRVIIIVISPSTLSSVMLRFFHFTSALVSGLFAVMTGRPAQAAFPKFKHLTFNLPVQFKCLL